LRGVASRKEIAHYRPAIIEAVKKYSTESRPLEERDTYDKAFLQVPNLWAKDNTVRQFVLAKRFGKIAAELMGVDAVRIYHDQALFKEAGGGHTPWHQDKFYWPLDTEHTLTIWIPLVRVQRNMGPLQFASKSHKEGYLGDFPISDESERYFQDLLEERGLDISGNPEMNAGDASFHHGWTLHRASANISSEMREVMTIIYFADGTRVLQSDSEVHAGEIDSWLSGLRAGELVADTELNPVIYRR
jgi:ectoine hydroxylase-related dioxygenase (phytanoyl-CoA dioxygenase family)